MLNKEENANKNVIKYIIKYLPSQIVPAMVGIISILIITRLFPPGDYGNYVLVMASISVFSTLVGWLSMSIIRFYPIYKRDEKLEQFYANIIKLSIISIGIISFIFSTILLFTKSYIPSGLYFLMWIGVIIFILTSFFEILLDFLRVTSQMERL
ncbi:MAG TPA: hypothetical protein DEG96_09905 [Candidatus Atribacteria bacterium]|uniref:Putative polysaccharide export protein n=1 Tax=candidate division TA06 bacterium 34_109 TaxID=1635277 RepID=A0A101HZD7_UNCT6|nr:MAG: putative polysaccharide export protein [candidate division TA06 bacterium 34_109]HBY58147.1 hypothetical protein [Candidatus Atribacteria bacterium]